MTSVNSFKVTGWDFEFKYFFGLSLYRRDNSLLPKSKLLNIFRLWQNQAFRLAAMLASDRALCSKSRLLNVNIAESVYCMCIRRCPVHLLAKRIRNFCKMSIVRNETNSVFDEQPTFFCLQSPVRVDSPFPNFYLNSIQNRSHEFRFYLGQNPS